MSGEGAFARLGASVLSYLASLSLKQQLLTLLVFKGDEGFPAAQLLAAEDDPAALLAAAEELRSEGKLARREHPGGQIFWAYPGEYPDTQPHPDIGDAAKARNQARRRPDRANDGGPDTGGRKM